MGRQEDGKKAFEAKGRLEKLFESVKEGDIEAIEKAAKACVQAKDANSVSDVLKEVKDAHGRTCLHFAARLGDDDTCDWLMSKGCELDVVDEQGGTPLSLACIDGHEELAIKFLEEGASVRCKEEDKIGSASCLHRASSAGSVDLVEALVKHGANTECAVESGTALHWAAGDGHADVIEKLIDLGSNVNAQNSVKITPLFVAAAAGHEDAAKALLKAKADPNLLGPDGATVLHVVADMGNEDLIQELLKHGACPTSADAHGQMAIHAAACQGNEAIVKLLFDKSFPNGTDETVESLIQKGKEESAKVAKQQAGDATPVVAKHEVSADAAEKAAQFKKEGNELFVIHKDYEGALEKYTQAILLDPNQEQMFGNRSACYHHLGQFERAVEDAIAAKRLNPKWVKAFYRLGMGYMGMEDYEEAAVAFFEGVQLDSNNIELSKKFQEAIELGKKKHKETEEATKGGKKNKGKKK